MTFLKNPISSAKFHLSQKLDDFYKDRYQKRLRELNLFPIHETKDSDIFIVGYPKSGNTWMQNMVSSLLYCPDASYLPDRLSQEIVPDIYTKKFYKRYGELTFFKSHELPQPNYKNVIYLIRDGRDAIVSFYHMNKIFGKDYSMEEMVLEGKGLNPCKWHTHVKNWQENPYNSRIIFVRYEDLIKNPLPELKKVCQFAGIQRTDRVLESVIQTNSFKNLQNREDKFGFENPHWNPDSPEKRFFRKGKIGSYLEEMDSSIQKHFVHEAKDELLANGYAIN